jgi:hypothetical protein
MKRQILFSSISGALLLLVCPSLIWGQSLRQSQGSAPTPPVQDRVERFTGTNLGVVVDRRANRRFVRDGSDSRVASVDIASPAEALSYQRSGVVYNYAMQSYGLISGEISFKVRDGVNSASFAWGQTPLPRRLVGPTVLVVNAPSLDEFLRVMKMLRGDNRILWVEPSVEYVPLSIK